MPNFAWAKNLSGNNNEHGYDINYDKCGNVYVCGYFRGSVDFDPGTSTNILNSISSDRLFLAKYSPTGQHIWAFAIGSPSVTSYAFEIEVDNSGNVYLTGVFDDANSSKASDFDPGPGTATMVPSAFDAFLAKYNTNGQYQWAFKIGSPINDGAYRLEMDPAGNLVVAGDFEGVTDFDPSASTFTLNCVSGNKDMFVAKYNTNGNFINAVSVFANPGFAVAAYGLTVDNSNNIYVTGMYQGAKLTSGTYTLGSTSPSGNDGYVLKLNSGLTVTNGFNFGSPITGTDRGSDLSIDNTSGEMLLTGLITGTVDIDPGPGTFTLVGTSSGKNFLAKYNSSFQLVWAFTSDAFFGKIKFEPSGNFYALGSLTGTADLDPSPAIANYTSVSSFDLLVANYTGSGAFNSAFNLGSGGFNDLIGMDYNPNIGLAFTGYFQQTMDFDPGPGTSNVTNMNMDDIYIANYTLVPIPFMTTSGTGSIICSGQTATLNATGANTYSWSTGATASTTTISPITTTSYSVTGTFTNGCTITSVITQSVSSCLNINPFTPLNSGIGIFPNPTNGEFFILINKVSENTVMEIYNTLGQVVKHGQLTSLETKINLSEQANGIYFVKVIENGKAIYYSKIIKN